MKTDDPHNLVARGYDQIADRYLAWSTDHSVRRTWLGHLWAELNPPARVLDLGCGAGIPVAQWLVEAGFTVTGVDGSVEQIERARQNVPTGRFLQGDMGQVEFAPGQFDAIVSTYAITHVRRKQHAALFASIHSWLRPGGWFLASLGAQDSPDWTGEWLGTEMFFSHFDAETNRTLLEAAGFDIKRAEVVSEDEDGAPVAFYWVLART